jgi:3-hydroxyacyl-[acyl-carrier-protein] dehydratase
VPVVPGDQLILETTLSNQRRNFWVFEGKASVDGKLAAQAEIKLMLQPS